MLMFRRDEQALDQIVMSNQLGDFHIEDEYG
jgi:hypothetical protein